MIGLAAFRELGQRSTGTAKQPRSFCEPGAKPRQGRAVVLLPSEVCVLIVLGGMAVGVVGSLVSLGRSQV